MRVAIVLFGFALPAFPQFGTMGSCSASGATVRISFRAPMHMAFVAGAPYSARETTGSAQPGAELRSDGQYESVWRDAKGRTRRETHAEEGARAPCRSFLAMIEDPVAGFAYLVDPVNKVVHRVALVGSPLEREPPPREGEESLGTKTMFGVTVTGRRFIRTVPPPPRRPNDPPRNLTVEAWRSPELKLEVYTKITQPDGPEQISALKDLSRADPDGALFRPPAGYQVVDETGPFVVKTGDGGPAARGMASAGPNRSPSVFPPATSAIVAHTADPATSPVPLRAFERFLPLEDSGDHSAAISLGDVNGDVNLDVVLSTGRHWESPIRLYLADGKGGFKVAGDIGSQGYASYGAPLVDLNGDGFLDLPVGTDSGGDKPVFFGDGKGHFKLSGSFGDPGMPARNIAVGDLNGDGFPDIAIANRGTQSFVYLNDGKGGFAEKRPFGGGRDSTVTVAIADVNGDGKPDLVIARRDGQQSVALINDGKGNFSDPRPFGPADADTRAVAVGDLNGDGYPDVVACHLGVGTFVYFNDGHGNFGKPVRIADAADGFFSLLIADLNRDHKLDIIGGNVDRPNVIFFNEKDGSSYQRVEFGGVAGAATYGLAAGDVDGDGFPDIAVARTGAPSGIFISSGAGKKK